MEVTAILLLMGFEENCLPWIPVPLCFLSLCLEDGFTELQKAQPPHQSH